MTVDRSLGGGDWGRRRGVDWLLGGGRFVYRGSRGGLGIDRLGRGNGDRGGWRWGRDVHRVGVGLQRNIFQLGNIFKPASLQLKLSEILRI